jgi:hypothetical protein
MPLSSSESYMLEYASENPSSSQGGVHKLKEPESDVAKSQSQKTAVATTIIKQINSCILELRCKNLRENLFFKPRSRKAAELIIKHRAANLTYIP